jgi:uracil-DNA glycosylase family 4
MNIEKKMRLLQELYDEWAECSRCPLAKPTGRHRHNIVFGEGNPDAKVLIVGEAPGEQEDITGHPFAGRSGEVLDMFLDSCCSNRDEVFIVNIVACRPTEHDDPKANRRPTKTEMKACRPRLDRIIEVVDPYVVVMLGTVAMKALTSEKTNITSVARKNPGPALDVVTQGTMVELTRPGFATFHPSYLLRIGMPLEPEGDVHKAYKTFHKAFTMADTYAELYHGITPPRRTKDE